MAYGDDLKVYGPYTRSDGRQIVITVNRKGERQTVSYPKFILQKHLGRSLNPDLETVDHWDSNFLNNDLSNLRIVPRHEHSADDTRRVKLVKFKCVWCKKKFERSPRRLRDKAKKNQAGPFCSRKCAGKYSRNLQLKLINRLDSQPAMDSHYYKRKYKKASLYELNLYSKIDDIWHTIQKKASSLSKVKLAHEIYSIWNYIEKRS